MPHERECRRCEKPFQPRGSDTYYCSISCSKKGKGLGVQRLDLRKVERPSPEQLHADLEKMGFSATGRKYGVSDNAVRKWLVWYERQREREAAA